MLTDLQAFDCCVIESTGISLPMPVAASFAFMDQEQQQQDEGANNHSSSSSSSGGGSSSSSGGGSAELGLHQLAQLDTLVTVVDGQRFVRDVLGSELLQDRGLQADEEDERTVAELLIEQVCVTWRSVLTEVWRFRRHKNGSDEHLQEAGCV